MYSPNLLIYLRIKETLTEIKAVAKKEPVLAAEGAVLFLEKLAPAIEQVDSSSGCIGSAVNRAIENLVPIIAKADVARAVREKWLDRLFEALQEDDMPGVPRRLLGRVVFDTGDCCKVGRISAADVDVNVGHCARTGEYGYATTNLTTFKAIAKKYPGKLKETILRDLVASQPGQEGKWFAAAKDAGLFDLAIELANRSPADPKTLIRAASMVS